jgi:parallel beta-helix repeat protein
MRISSSEISGPTGLLVLALTLCSGFFSSTNAQDVPAAQSSGSGPGAWNFQIVDNQSAKSLADETATQNALPVHGANYTLAMLYPPFVKTIGFNNLSYLAEVSPTSPATIAAGDLAEQFYAPNGRLVTVVVKMPVTDKVYSVPPITQGADPANYIQGAIAAAGPNTIITFPKRQVYNFAAINCTNPSAPDYAGAHLQFANAQDVVIDGNGGLLNFSSPCRGVYMVNLSRVVFKNFTIDWPHLQFASLGTVTAIGGNGRTGYTYNLQLKPQFIGSALNSVAAITAWDPINNYWSIDSPNQDVSYRRNLITLTASGNATNVPSYGIQLTLGETLVVRHMVDAPVFNVGGQDVTLDNITMESGPGIGFLFSQGRGFHINNCQITRSNGRPISTMADAVHSGSTAGDIVIENSTFAYQGDDGTNFHTTMNPITVSNTNQITIPSWIYSLPGDPIALFNPLMGFTGYTTIAAGGVKKNGNGTSTITLVSSLTDADLGGFAADMAMPAARYIIRNNQYLYNRARGVLLQSAYGFVHGNTFTGQTMQHIYVVSSAFWGEGAGAQNLLIAGNRLSQSGKNKELASVVVAQESVKGVSYVSSSAPAGTSPIPPTQQNLVFVNNTISDEPRAGIYLSSANNVILYGNTFINTNQSSSSRDFAATTPSLAPTNYPIVIDDASNVYQCDNQFLGWGSTMSPIWFDPNSTSGLMLGCKK